VSVSAQQRLRRAAAAFGEGLKTEPVDSADSGFRKLNRELEEAAMALPRESKCRFCGKTGEDLVKYGVRHYAHAKCGLAREGVKFLDRLPLAELESFPALATSEFGLFETFMEKVEDARRKAGLVKHPRLGWIRAEKGGA
jgi:hypothetical protein